MQIFRSNALLREIQIIIDGSQSLSLFLKQSWTEKRLTHAGSQCTCWIFQKNIFWDALRNSDGKMESWLVAWKITRYPSSSSCNFRFIQLRFLWSTLSSASRRASRRSGRTVPRTSIGWCTLAADFQVYILVLALHDFDFADCQSIKTSSKY